MFSFGGAGHSAHGLQAACLVEANAVFAHAAPDWTGATARKVKDGGISVM